MKMFAPGRIVLVLLLTLLASPGLLTSASAQTPASDSGIYSDPGGRFTVPVPETWSVEESPGYVDLVDPDDDFRIAIVIVTAGTASVGIDAAWEIVEPGFSMEPLPGGEQDLPSDEGVDETLVITYDIGETSGQVVQALGLRTGQEVAVVLLRGSLDAAIRRDAQIQTIVTGLSRTGVVTPDLTGTNPLAFDAEMAVELELYTDGLMSVFQIPGASVVIVQNGEIVYSDGFGVTVQGGADPVGPDTLMMIGSTTKSFTTAMMATMVDDGLFEWDTPVVEIVPSFAMADSELTDQITIENLVCACTGVPRRDLEFAFNANELTAEEVIQSLSEFDLFTDFGETFQYSNQMVATGGYIAAEAGGGLYGDLDDAYGRELRSRILDPLGMTRTTNSFLLATTDPDVAMPHGAQLDGSYTPLDITDEVILEPVGPAGSLWSSANELGLYLQMQLQDGISADGVQVVSADNVLHTREPQVLMNADMSYGLGWMISDYQGLPLISHGGNTLGFTSELMFLPNSGIGIAVLTNARGSNAFNQGVVFRTLELLFDQPPAFQEQIDYVLQTSNGASLDVANRVGDAPSLSDVAFYLGTYANGVLGEVQLAWGANTGFTLDAGEFTSELRPVNGAEEGGVNFVGWDGVLAGQPLTIRFDDAGTPQIELTTGVDAYLFAFTGASESDEPPAGGSPAATPFAISS